MLKRLMVYQVVILINNEDGPDKQRKVDGGRGGGYYEGPDEKDINNEDLKVKCLGGFGGTSWKISHRGGNGGTAGKGGNIKISNNSKLYAFNGNKYSDESSTNNEVDQAAIYLQAGITLNHYKVTALSSYDYSSPDIYPTLVLENVGTINNAKTGYVNQYYNNLSTSQKMKTFNSVLNSVDMSLQGIGSGAGYIELSNGTYEVDSSLN